MVVQLWLEVSRSLPEACVVRRLVVEAVGAKESGLQSGASCRERHPHLGGRRLESRGAAAHGREDRDTSVALGWCPVLFCVSHLCLRVGCLGVGVGCCRRCLCPGCCCLSVLRFS